MKLWDAEPVWWFDCTKFRIKWNRQLYFKDEFFQNYGSRLAQKDATSDLKLTKFLEQVKRRGQNQEYDR